MDLISFRPTAVFRNADFGLCIPALASAKLFDLRTSTVAVDDIDNVRTKCEISLSLRPTEKRAMCINHETKLSKCREEYKQGGPKTGLLLKVCNSRIC